MADEVGSQQPNLHLEPKWLRVRARTTELRSQHACRNAQKPMTPDSADANGQEAESALTLHNDGTAARDWCSPDNAHKLGLARGCTSAILIIIRQPAKPDALHQCNSNIFKCSSLRLNKDGASRTRRGGTQHAQFDRVFHQQCASSSGRAPTLPKRIPRREPNHPTETPSARKYNIRTCNCETLPVWSCAEEVRGSATEHAANAAGYPRCSRNSPPCTAPPHLARNECGQAEGRQLARAAAAPQATGNTREADAAKPPRDIVGNLVQHAAFCTTSSVQRP